jgi:hypothetical protein
MSYCSDTSSPVSYDVHECNKTITSNASEGHIKWIIAQNSSNCVLELDVTESRYVMAYVTLLDTVSQCWRENLSEKGFKTRVMVVLYKWPQQTKVTREVDVMMYGAIPHFHLVFAPANQVFFWAKDLARSFAIRFITSTRRLDQQFIHEETEEGGVLASPGYDGVTALSINAEISHTVQVPAGFNSIMLSFDEFLILQPQRFSDSFLELAVLNPRSGFLTTVWHYSHPSKLPAQVYETSQIQLTLKTFSRYQTWFDERTLGFKMRYTFHTQQNRPDQLSDGVLTAPLPTTGPSSTICTATWLWSVKMAATRLEPALTAAPPARAAWLRPRANACLRSPIKAEDASTTTGKLAARRKGAGLPSYALLQTAETLDVCWTSLCTAIFATPSTWACTTG